LRAARLSFLRSALSLMFLVFIISVTSAVRRRGMKFLCYAFSKPAYCAINFFWP
jgi:hypothetical protein